MGHTVRTNRWRILVLLILLLIFGPVVLFQFWQPWARVTTDPSQGGCPVGTTLLAKFEWSGGRYKFEKPTGNEGVVFVVGDATGGSWTSTLPVSFVILKGSTGYAWTEYNPAAFSGTFSKSILPPNPGGNIPDISNIQFCGSEEAEAGLRVTKTVNWNGVTPDTAKTFTVCISGPSFPATPDCKVADFDGETLTWFGLDPGVYVVTEQSPGAAWEVTLPGDTTVVAGQVASAGVTNTYRLGTLAITKSVDWGDAQPDSSQQFEICIEGPSFPAGDCKTATFEGGTLTWQGILPGEYVVEERGVDAAEWTVTIDATPVTVPVGGGTATVAVRNERLQPPGHLRVVKVDLGTAAASGTWVFTASGPTTPGPVSITDTGEATFADLEPGSYSVTETTGSGEACVIGVSEPGAFETLHGATGNPALAEAGLTMGDIGVLAGETTTVYFFNRSCGSVLGSPALYIQKYEDPSGNRTGETGLSGFQFIVKRDGVQVGAAVTSPAGGLIVLSGLDAGMYTVEEVAQAGYRFTGTRVDREADGSYDSEHEGQPAAVELLHAGDAAWITFYNQPRINVRVTKVETGNGASSPGAGWTFTLSGCGIAERTGVTGADGTLTFTDLPPAVGCEYTVTEAVASGWTVSPSASQLVGSAIAGATVDVQFTNRREPTPTPAPTSTPVPTGTPTPETPSTPGTPETPTTPTPTGTPEVTRTPGATETPTAVPAEPTETPDSGVVGEKTPRPPISGQSPDSGGSSSMAILLAALVLFGLSAVAGGLAFRRRQ